MTLPATVRKQLPNVLTVLRFPLTALFLYGWLKERKRWHLLAIVSFLAAVVTDWLDGHLARKENIESKFGAFLDPLADKVLTISGFSALLFTPGFRWGNWKPWIILSLSLITLREAGITLLRSMMVKGDAPLATSWWGKWKTSVQMGTLITAFSGQVLREASGRRLRWFESLIGGGVLASTLLATVSGLNYLRAARNADRSPRS